MRAVQQPEGRSVSAVHDAVEDSSSMSNLQPINGIQWPTCARKVSRSWMSARVRCSMGSRGATASPRRPSCSSSTCSSSDKRARKEVTALKATHESQDRFQLRPPMCEGKERQTQPPAPTSRRRMSTSSHRASMSCTPIRAGRTCRTSMACGRSGPEHRRERVQQH